MRRRRVTLIQHSYPESEPQASQRYPARIVVCRRLGTRIFQGRTSRDPYRLVGSEIVKFDLLAKETIQSLELVILQPIDVPCRYITAVTVVGEMVANNSSCQSVLRVPDNHAPTATIKSRYASNPVQNHRHRLNPTTTAFSETCLSATSERTRST